ncbi:hypothetical protein ACET3Z_018503 [Daucus carota]
MPNSLFSPLNQTLVSRVRSIRSRAVVHDESSQKKTQHPQTEQSKSVSDKSNEFDKKNRPNGTGIPVTGGIINSESPASVIGGISATPASECITSRSPLFDLSNHQSWNIGSNVRPANDLDKQNKPHSTKMTTDKGISKRKNQGKRVVQTKTATQTTGIQCRKKYRVIQKDAINDTRSQLFEDPTVTTGESEVPSEALNGMPEYLVEDDEMLYDGELLSNNDSDEDDIVAPDNDLPTIKGRTYY